VRQERRRIKATYDRAAADDDLKSSSKHQKKRLLPSSDKLCVSVSFSLAVICSIWLNAVKLQRSNPFEFLKRRQRRPTFYLHVGLHKTGTTFLQRALCFQAKFTRPLLLQNNLEYLGTCPGAPFKGRIIRHVLPSIFKDHFRTSTCYVNLTQHERLTEIKTDYPFNDNFNFISRIEALRETGQDVLFVYEVCSCFSDRMIQQLHEFLSPTWDVKILVVHRTFHECLVSFHDENHKLLNHELRNWTKQVIPMDLDNPDIDTSQILAAVENHNKHPAVIVQQMYQRYFQNVRLVSLNELASFQPKDSKGDPLLEYILCTFVPTAAHVCNLERYGRISAYARRRNAQSDRTFDLVTQEAHRQGLIHDSASRTHIASILRREISQQRLVLQKAAEVGFRKPINRTDFDSFPLRCPSLATLERLKRVSTLVDRAVFQNWTKEQVWTEQQQKAHQESFYKLVDQRKLCFVNATAVLRDASWRSFFADLYSNHTIKGNDTHSPLS